MIGNILVRRNHAAAASAGSRYSQATCGWPPAKQDGARADHRVDLAASQHAGDRGARRRILHAHIGRQVHRDLLDPSGLLVAAAHPGDVRRLHPVFVLEHGARPDIGGYLVFRHTDAAALQIFGPRDPAVGADVDRVVAERARGKYRHTDIRAVAVRRLDREAAHRQLANIEVGVAERAEKDFFRFQQHEHRIDAVDLHRAIHQRAHPVVVADGNRQYEFAHGIPPYLRSANEYRPSKKGDTSALSAVSDSRGASWSLRDSRFSAIGY
jgi:hypothetical protein